jgi:hypothetical protein
MKRIGILIAALGLFLFVQAAQADWTPAKRLTWTSGSSQNPTIAADSLGNVHVVWNDDTPGNNEIYHKKSTNGGTNWGTAKRLTWTSGQSFCPVDAVDSSGILHIVWSENTVGTSEIYYGKTADGGVTWTANKRLTWNSGISWRPDIAVGPFDSLHVAWSDSTPGNAEIYYKKSSDGGVTWLAGKRLTWTSGSSYLPDLTVDSAGNLHLVWSDETPGATEIFYKKSTNDGVTWTSSKRLTWTSGSSWGPDIAVDTSGNLHVVWGDDTPGNYAVYYKKSTNGGGTWTPAKLIAGGPVGGSWPDLGVDPSGHLHILGTGYVYDPGWDDSFPEIFYITSTDGGTTWSTKEMLTSRSYGSQSPAIFVDSSGNLFGVWENGYDGEIYFGKGTW